MLTEPISTSVLHYHSVGDSQETVRKGIKINVAKIKLSSLFVSVLNLYFP